MLVEALVTCILGYCLLRWQLNRGVSRRRGGPVKMMCVLGSGGHTAEMFQVLLAMNRDLFTPRVYVAAGTDRMADEKVVQHEAKWAAKASAGESSDSNAVEEANEAKEQQPVFPSVAGNNGGVATGAEGAAAALRRKGSGSLGAGEHSGTAPIVHRIPRSREVGQSWASTVWTTALACPPAFCIVWTEWPALLLVNGPGTCLPVCIAASTFRWLGLLNVRIVFVESVARTQKLSLTGKLLYAGRITDRFFVQWPQLQKNYPRASHEGRVY